MYYVPGEPDVYLVEHKIEFTTPLVLRLTSIIWRWISVIFFKYSSDITVGI